MFAHLKLFAVLVIFGMVVALFFTVVLVVDFFRRSRELKQDCPCEDGDTATGVRPVKCRPVKLPEEFKKT